MFFRSESNFTLPERNMQTTENIAITATSHVCLSSGYEFIFSSRRNAFSERLLLLALKKWGRNSRQNIVVPTIANDANIPKSLSSADSVNISPMNAPIVVSTPSITGLVCSFITVSGSLTYL